MLVIGDLQGCLGSLHALLEELGPTGASAERIVFLGDLVNRGPASLETLRFVRSLGDRAVALLGNHDLHLLAVAAGIRPMHRDDTLADVLAAPDREVLLDWLRMRPLAHLENGALFVHAGVLPQWSAQKALALAREVEACLSGSDYRDFLRQMYGNTPARWDDALTGADRLRCVINAFTRLRFVDVDGTMDLKVKEGAGAAPPGFVPWFDHPARATDPAYGGLPVVFGHWSTLGLFARPDVVCLDTGCVWGGRLTAMRWPARTVVQVPCPQAAQPGAA
jgi:bis(5'-nucleosyl)-tetraphosphatase (symmetrical)